MGIKEYILSGNFEKAFREIDMDDFEEARQEVMEGAYKTENIKFYDFLAYIIEKHEGSARMHYYASELIVAAFRYILDASHIAFKHARKAIELAPQDVSLKEYILLFYEMPDRLLEKSLAVQYARDILQADPQNQAARQILGEPN